MSNIKKLKVYLDTSVISHLDAPDTPDKMEDTKRLWKEIKRGKYEVVVSDITVEEMEKCDEPKKSLLYSFMAEIEITTSDETDESIELAKKYMQYGVLKEKNRDDCRHIGLATVSDVDYIISWNFKHFVNVKTIEQVQAINKLLGYREIQIISPPMLSGGDDENDG